jgi:protein subunit release factor B
VSRIFRGEQYLLMKHLLIWLESLPTKLTLASSHYVKWKACRSSGPGGQHVNKTNSRAELIISRPFFPAELQEKIVDVRVESQIHRHFVQNQEECRRRVIKMAGRVVREVMPKGTSAEQIKRVEGFKKVHEQKRLEAKKHLKEKKASRSAARAFTYD